VHHAALHVTQRHSGMKSSEDDAKHWFGSACSTPRVLDSSGVNCVPHLPRRGVGVLQLDLCHIFAHLTSCWKRRVFEGGLELEGCFCFNMAVRKSSSDLKCACSDK